MCRIASAKKWDMGINPSFEVDPSSAKRLKHRFAFPPVIRLDGAETSPEIPGELSV